MKRRLLRPRNDRVISGVCSGIANYLDTDPTLIRIAAVLTAIWSFGTAILVYLALAIIIPQETPQQVTPQKPAEVITP